MQDRQVLLFAEISANNRADVEAAQNAINQIGATNRFTVTYTEDKTIFNEEELKQFSTIVFLYTSGEVLNDEQRADVERYVQAGGEILGMEALPITKNEWSWFYDHMSKSTSQISISSDSLEDRLIGSFVSQLDYALATTLRVTEENRFVKEVLDFNLNEPMELDELPGIGMIFVERRGAIKLYEFESRTTKTIYQQPVFYGNEDGLLGIAVDPNFEINNWIYLFYSAEGDDPVQHVSRFDLKGDSIDPASEKLLLTIPTIRKCCHSGGALEFGPNGNLFIALGDNTNPFESSGYAPIDERPERALWDAQKSASNTNDLRGKILRIKPEDNGTYSIPEGNLFPPGTPNTRPEIYVMGCRNPFRPSIDTKTGYVYWGDVGPDAGQSDSSRGPKGMGEFNQARNSGFWGWPYTRGNNQSYHDYNFSTKTSGEPFDPQKIINNSPNNTGIEVLPPVQESLIWYSYDSSGEFPWLGKGGVNPMAGPVFHASDYAEGFPDYFENKLFVYEWMRDWIYVVTLDENQQYLKAEAFMPNTEFSHPMDMLFGSDGNLYMLEYGQKWNTQNLDARLSRIKYVKGNRTPVAKIGVNKEVGAAPLTVNFQGDQSIDYDDDPLSFQWDFGFTNLKSSDVNPTVTFEKEGIYITKLTVKDQDGEMDSITQKILVGNEPPQLSIQISEEDNLYWDGRELNYNVMVVDREDGTTENGEIDPGKVKVTMTYLPEGEDIVLATVGHQQNAIPAGKALIDGADCKACHAKEEKVNGPAYMDIATKYTAEDKSVLIGRVLKGSVGVWGETMMAAHPQLSISEVGKMVDYILSLKYEDTPDEKKMPLTGTLKFLDHMENEPGGKYIFMASYVDSGNPSIEGSALATNEQVIFTTPKKEAEEAEEMSDGLSVWNNMGATLVGSIAHNSYLKFEDITFDNLHSIELSAVYSAGYHYAGSVQLREGSLDGPIIGTGNLDYADEDKGSMEYYDIAVNPSIRKGPLYLVFHNPKDEDQIILNANWIMLKYERKEI